MMLIIYILIVLALLASLISIAMNFHERKRRMKRDADLVRYIDKTVNSKSVSFDERVKKLEQGVIPDYEQAKAAANAVNDFNCGISNILGFDPVSALKKEREKERAGGYSE